MSDEYELRRDITRFNMFLANLDDDLRTNFNKDINSLGQVIDDIKRSHYDTSETYSKEEADSLGDDWKEIGIKEGVTLYVNSFVRLCELVISLSDVYIGANSNYLVGTLPSTTFRPVGYVVSPIRHDSEVYVYAYANTSSVYARNYNTSSAKTVTIRTSLMWHY